MDQNFSFSIYKLPNISLGGGETDPEESYSASLIGIAVAISGNILISLALNCQKLAHLRLSRERRSRASRTANGHGRGRKTNGRLSLAKLAGQSFESVREESITENPESRSFDRDRDEERIRFLSPEIANEDTNNDIPFPELETPIRPHRRNSHNFEEEPLLSSVASTPHGSIRSVIPLYGTKASSRAASHTDETSRHSRRRSASSPHILTRIFSSGAKGKSRAEDVDLEASPIPVDVHFRGEDGVCPTPRSATKIKISEPAQKDGNESDYLKSKLWWLGFILMNIGEIGNFISYGFAPASVVAPLGTFALIANCFFAPLMLKERFRKKDLFGVALAIMGAVTVVLSASSSDKRLDPHALILAITQRAFIVLAVVYTAGVAILVSLSSRKVGQEHVFIDVGACAFFGGFTVLSTKAFSSLLTMEWAAVFKEWITYPVLAILLGTGVGQIKYLNRALMKFDSKIVIPTQFVLFNLSAIVGSAVLYGDFRSASLHQMVTFLYGCGATFAGVFMLTWGSGNVEHGEGNESVRSSAMDSERGLRNGRAQLILPASVSSRPTIVRTKTSSLTLSPAQRALLVRTLSEESDK